MGDSQSPLLCPHCNARLRIQDRRLIGKQVRCPDCSGVLVVVSDGAADLRVETGVAPPDKTASSGTSASKRSKPRRAPENQSAPRNPPAPKAPRLQTQLAKWASGALRRPTAVGWTVSGCLVLVLVWILWPRDDDRRMDPRGGEHAAIEPEQPPAEPSPPKPEHSGPPSIADDTHDREPDRRPDAAVRLERLGERLSAFVAAHGHFPPGSAGPADRPASDQFSWLALVAAEGSPSATARPLWDRSWRDPRNAPFVRQRLREFQNTDIEQLVGADGYPATHYVGMAGVGADAPRLPVHHRRAGIFGDHRRTTVADVKDGLSETILVAGVQEGIGGWAAGGDATRRPLVEQPYVNGPDGFGTGQRDGMYVLMADGRVRFVAKSVDPVLLERMAAMSDEFASNSSTPDRPPGEQHPAVAAAPDAQQVADRSDSNNAVPAIAPRPLPVADRRDPAAGFDEGEPIPSDVPRDVAEQEPLSPVDVAKSLEQPIRRFEQRDAVPLETLLWQIEEMAGIAITFDELEDPEVPAALATLVSVTLTDTSLGEILNAVVEKAGLSYDIGPGGVRLRSQRRVPARPAAD